MEKLSFQNRKSPDLAADRSGDSHPKDVKIAVCWRTKYVLGQTFVLTQRSGGAKILRNQAVFLWLLLHPHHTWKSAIRWLEKKKAFKLRKQNTFQKYLLTLSPTKTSRRGVMVVTGLSVKAAFHSSVFTVRQAEHDCEEIPLQVHLFFSATS